MITNRNYQFNKSLNIYNHQVKYYEFILHSNLYINNHDKFYHNHLVNEELILTTVF